MEKTSLGDRVLLSICIPTYNRSEYLKKTVDSILCQERFFNHNDIEIVISDNCSSDNTEAVAREYVASWGERIKYHRNPSNIRDANFEKVLSLGCGEYLKLNNDTLSHAANSMEFLTDSLLQHIDNKTLLFFDNGMTKGKENHIFCSDINCFVSKVSFWITWIGCFGIWKRDFVALENFNDCSSLQLTQVDIWLALVSKNKNVLIVKSKYAESQELGKKGGYNIIEVFVRNYFYILNKYSSENGLKRNVIFWEKFKLMRWFLLPWIVKILAESKYDFSLQNGLKILVKEYRFHPGLLFFILVFPIWYLCGLFDARNKL